MFNLITSGFSFPGLVSQLVSLTLDGLTGVSQDHMRARFQTTANYMMLNINLWSTLVLGLGESDVLATRNLCQGPLYQKHTEVLST